MSGLRLEGVMTAETALWLVESGTSLPWFHLPVANVQTLAPDAQDGDFHICDILD